MDPSPKKKPKPLYKAKNISGLRKTAYKLEKKDIRTLIKDSDELYRKAQGAKSDMDDELSYESFYQYVKIVLHVQKRKEYMDDKKYYNSLVGSIKINSAIQELDRLTDILQKRYENIEVEESVSRPSMTIKPSNGKRSPSLPVIQPIKPVPNEKVSPFKDKLTINANELMQMLNNHQLSLLIMDCRPKSEFAESHLTKPTCLNVPEEIIKKGMSAGKIQSELSLDGRTLWASRSTKDFVVLMDWNSGGANIQQPLLILQHILLNYDPDVQYQNRLLMLEDGYESLKNTYPMCVFNPHYQPPRVLFQFNDGLDNVEYPVLTDIKMKEDNMGDRRQPIIDRSSKEAVLQRERQFVRDKKIEAEKSMFEMLQMEVEFNKTTRIAETLPESDAKIGELLTKKMELGNKIIELEDINQNLDLDITNSLNEQRAVIADAYQDPEDDDFGSSDRVVDEKEAAIIEEQVRLLEELNENRRRVERERKPLAEKREREMTLDIERTRRIEQNNNVVIPPRPVQQPQPSFDRSVKPMFVEEEPPVIRHFNAEPGSEGHGLTGLKNLGNTCYMNSIMQCLSNTPMLKDFFISDDGYRKQFHRTNRSQRAIAEEFSAVIREIWLNKHRHISSNDLRRVIGQCKQIFRGMDQQDSHEFLTILMDWLHLDLQPKKQMIIPSVKLSAAEKAWLEFVKCEESYIMKLFYGQIKSTVKCTICNGESATYEGFSNLSLELPENSKRCSIENCMKMYFYGERISGWNCPSCKAPRDAIKKLDITKLPPILVIHFKRFNVDLESSSNRYTKKQTFVEFPLTGFDVFEYIAPLEKNSVSARNSVYQLYGVSNHYGTMERGHYTAFCKSSYYGKWFKYDDHIVSPMDSSVVTSSAAYILFYTSI